MNITDFRHRLLGSTMIGGLTVAAASLALASAAQAQSTPSGEPQDESATQVDDIVVTGSRIARQDYVATSPIVTVGQEDFQATGSVTIDTLVNDLPQFVPSVNSTSNNPSNGGQANIDLRGLGTARTLVLMNGRRIVPSNSDGTVDVNLIPTSLIRNVEVITGGASAAYGSDALAGVANFILNDSFEGVQIDAQYGVTDQDDGVTEAYSLTLGAPFADGRGHAIMTVGRSVRDQIFNAARDFSSIGGFSNASPLGNTVFDGTNQPSQAFLNTYFGTTGTTLAQGGSFGFNNDGSVFAYQGTRNFKSPGGITYDGAIGRQPDWAYNTAPLNLMQLPLQRWNLFSSLRYELSPAAEVYGDFLFTDYQAANELAASPAAAGTGFRVPSTNPFITPDLRAFLNARPNPAGSFRLDKRFTDLGGRRAEEDYTVYQGTFGVRGDLVGLRDWTYDIYAQYGRMERLTVQSGNVSRSAVQTLLSAPDGGASLCAGGFDFTGESNLSPACIAYIGRSSVNNTIMDQTVVEGSIQGGLWELPAGEARFATGIQYRGNDFSFRPDASLARINPLICDNGATPVGATNICPPGTGLIGGNEIAGFNAAQPLSGNTDSIEYFVELLVPVLKDIPLVQALDVSLGYRYADYNTVGGVSSYKADLDWTVVDGFRIRGGVQHSVRAPSIGELFAPLNTGFPAIGNPSATGLGGDPCDTRGFYRSAANPNRAQVVALCAAQAAVAAAPNFIYGNNQVQGVSGGNPDLTEETSDSWTAGVVLNSPFDNAWLSGMSASVDYYSIKIEDVIGAIPVTSQLQGCFNAQGQNPTYDPNNGFCQLFVRDANSGGIFLTQELNGNLGMLKTSGVDAQFDWRLVMGDIGLPAWGNIDLNIIAGWLESREKQEVAGGPIAERVGTIDVVTAGQFNTFPEWKLLTSLGWSNDTFSVGARWRYVDEMQVRGTTTILETTNYFDLNGSWNINETLSLRATVNNVTDEDPQTWVPGIQASTDPSTYDTLGRRYSIGLTARF